MSNRRMMMFTLGSNGSSYDPDAQAFLTATAITDLTISDAINNLVIELKAYGLWTKIIAFYPIVGGTAFTHKFNLKNPIDNDSAFRLSYVGTFIHTSSGIGATGGVANTHVNAISDLTNNDYHLMLYCITNTDGTIVDFGTQNYLPALYQRFTSLAVFDSPLRFLVSNLDSRGFYLGNRKSPVDASLFKNNTKIAFTSATNTPNNENNTIYIFDTLYPTDRVYSAFGLGLGFTDTEALDYYNIVQAFQTELGRQV